MLALQQFEFLGKMMGLALRTRNLLTLYLPSMVWKPLVGQPVDETDIEAIDVLQANVTSNIYILNFIFLKPMLAHIY